LINNHAFSSNILRRIDILYTFWASDTPAHWGAHLCHNFIFTLEQLRFISSSPFFPATVPLL